MQKILLATGDDLLLDVLQEHPDIKAVELVYLLEELGERVKEFQPNLLIITDFFDPDMIETGLIARKFPDLRIILIKTEAEKCNEFQEGLLQCDVLPATFKKSELFKLIDSSKAIELPRNSGDLSLKLPEGKLCAVRLEDYLETPKGESTSTRLHESDNGYLGKEEITNKKRIQVIRQQVLAFWSAKPGAGKSFLATTLAQSLKQSKLKVVLVDFDLNSLALGVSLGMHSPKKTLKGFINGLENDTWRDNLIYHPSNKNFAVLTGSELCRYESYTEVSKEQVYKVIDVLKNEFDILILDLNSDLKMVSTFVSLNACNQVFSILDQDYPSLFTTRKALGLLKRLNISKDKFKFILNKWDKGFTLSKGAVEEMLDIKIFETIPNYGPLVWESRLSGKEIRNLIHDEGQLAYLETLAKFIDPSLDWKPSKVVDMWKGFFGKVGLAHE